MDQQDCVIVGGGPGGVVLGYLLARSGLRVTLLEAWSDFARRFRGDSLAPAVMDFLDTLDPANDLLGCPHAVDAFVWHITRKAYRVADYSTACPAHPHYVLLPQAEFLTFMTGRAAEFPGFTLRMSARVNSLVTHADGRVAGVRYRAGNGQVHEVRAPLVVGTDGRFSQLRRLGGFPVQPLGAGLDILWYEVPRQVGDPDLSGLDYFSSPGRAVVALGQGASWQLGYVIPTGSVARVREAGLTPVVELMRAWLPWLAERLDTLTEFNQLTLLNVRITRLPRWYRPGLLLLGDAAHVISPVGGNGINIAIADAADAANTLAPLLAEAAPRCSTGHAGRSKTAAARSRTQQRSQVRAERGTLARIQRSNPEPAWILKLVAATPPLSRALGRCGSTGIRIPAPNPTIRHAAPTPRTQHVAPPDLPAKPGRQP